jgi:hypothetical protein
MIKGAGKDVVGKNIKEMEASGRPHKQAVAASLDQARKSGAKFNKGGEVGAEPQFKENLAETVANPTGPIGLKKGGNVPAEGKKGKWRRW